MSMSRGALAATLFSSLFMAASACAPVMSSGSKARAEQESISKELQAHAWPLLTVDEELDVAPLWDMIKGARIVGIGTAVRGAHEFRRITNTLLMRAADEERPLIVAIDVPFYVGLELDAWVRGEAVDEFDGGDETGNVFKWIRAHNQGVSPELKVRVVGLGASDRLSIASLVAYFDAVDPEAASAARGLFSRLADFEARQLLGELREKLVAGRAEYVAAAGREAHDQALRLVWSIGRSSDFARNEKGTYPRGQVDAAMAEHVAMLADMMPQARIVVVSRGAHTARSAHGEDPSMGRLLADRFGAGYAAVHMTFQHGTFFGFSGMTRKGRTVVRTGWAPNGTLEDTLHGPSRVYALDVRSAAADRDSLALYLREPSWTRSYPDVWTISRDGLPTAWSSVVPAGAFDALVHVRYVAIAH
jgi:erythromycin esterase-like protein